MKITVYSKSNCVQCNATYRKLDEKLKDRYTVLDIETDEDARTFAVGLGHMQAPVVVISDEDGKVIDHWSGYVPDKLNALANQLVPA